MLEKPQNAMEEEKMQPKAKVMDEKAVERAVIRISHQIIEKNKGTENLCLVGIQRRGVPLSLIHI